MKKILKKILFMVILVLSLTGCGNKIKTYEEISYKQFVQKIENKDSFILFIGAESCQHCSMYKNTINKIVENYQVKIYHIDMDKLSETEYSKFKTYINFSGTPTTAFIYDGKEENTYNRISGNKSYDKVKERLIKEGYIKE